MLSSKAYVKEFFGNRVNEWSACYSDPHAQSLSAQSLMSRQRIALELVGPLPRRSKILDVGCGTGEMAAKLLNGGLDVWGVDIAEAMIRRARQRCGSDQFRVGDIENLPFGDGSFDAIVCLGVIEYLTSAETALREIRRVLKPGGIAILSFPNAVCPIYYISRAVGGLLHTATAIQNLWMCPSEARQLASERVPSVPRVRKYRRGTLRGALRGAGLEPMEWICHGLGWPGTWLGASADAFSPHHGGVRRRVSRLIRSPAVQSMTGNAAAAPALNRLLAEQLVRARAVK